MAFRLAEVIGTFCGELSLGMLELTAILNEALVAPASRVAGRKVASTSFSSLAAFSLQQSKHITCGEGGLTVTSDEQLARRALLFSDKAWPREATSLGSCRFLFLAQNYRMSELQGAVALGQLPKIATSVASRRQRAAELTAMIADIPGVEPAYVSPNTRHSYWLYMLRVRPDARAFGEALLADGVPAWVQYIIDPLYFSPMFTERKTYGTSGYPLGEYSRQNYVRGLCPQAETTLKSVIAIHWNERYTTEHVSQIAGAIRRAASNAQD